MKNHQFTSKCEQRTGRKRTVKVDPNPQRKDRMVFQLQEPKNKSWKDADPGGSDSICAPFY